MRKWQFYNNCHGLRSSYFFSLFLLFSLESPGGSGAGSPIKPEEYWCWRFKKNLHRSGNVLIQIILPHNLEQYWNKIKQDPPLFCSAVKPQKLFKGIFPTCACAFISLSRLWLPVQWGFGGKGGTGWTGWRWVGELMRVVVLYVQGLTPQLKRVWRKAPCVIFCL